MNSIPVYNKIIQQALMIWVTLWQDQQNGICTLQRLRSAWASPKVWSVFAVRMTKAWVLIYPLSTQWRLIRLGGARHFVGFVVWRLIRVTNHTNTVFYTLMIRSYVLRFSMLLLKELFQKHFRHIQSTRNWYQKAKCNRTLYAVVNTIHIRSLKGTQVMLLLRPNTRTIFFIM